MLRRATNCKRNHRPSPRHGQALVFLLLTLVILLFVTLWNFDVHKNLFVKTLNRNGGDAAALAAARWQGTTLNLVGSLNILQALALSIDDDETVASVSNLQARLLYTGPMIALIAAQQAAKNNHLFQNDDFTERLREHAETVRNEYPGEVGPDGEMLFPEPFPDAWAIYAGMLDAIADDGVAAGPDNAAFYADSIDGHMLLLVDFYQAIAGRTWCWFHLNAPGILESYVNYQSWPPLPDITYEPFINSEIFGLGLHKVATPLNRIVETNFINDAAAAIDLPAAVTERGMTNTAIWICYGRHWGNWEAMDIGGDPPFPLTGPLKPKYNYAGADAAIRVESTLKRLTHGQNSDTVYNTLTWTAAAKPFGYLDDETPPNAEHLVIPAFHDIRLIPVDASSAPSGGSFNIGWRRHIEYHLPEYMERGTAGLSPGCWYCQQLRTWERDSFRAAGITWLEHYSDQCLPHGGRGGRGGGRRRGH